MTPNRWGFDWWRGEDPRLRAAVKAAAKMAAHGWAVPVSGYAWQAINAPYCDNPVPVSLSKRSRSAGPPVELSLLAPCRKCAKCLLFRQLKWRERAMTEIEKTFVEGRRTWFVTLTFSPVHLAGILAEAKVAGGGARRIERAAYGHVQKYLKRLRKESKSRIRYLAVYERGEETGRSHYHLLIHEAGGNPVLRRTIECQWRSHVHARLVGGGRSIGGAASYISKYATKAVDVRPRASLGYGRTAARRA